MTDKLSKFRTRLEKIDIDVTFALTDEAVIRLLAVFEPIVTVPAIVAFPLIFTVPSAFT